MTRDEFLQDKIGNYLISHFDTPLAFFELWEWAKEQEWFGRFIAYKLEIKMINPDRFADAVAHYLGWREND